MAPTTRSSSSALAPAEITSLDIAVGAWAEQTTLTKSQRRKLRRHERRAALGTENRPNVMDVIMRSEHADESGALAGERPRIPDVALVFDTETATDTSQRLQFGTCRIYERGQLQTEYLIYGDDLPEHDPDGHRVLQQYAETTPSEAPTAPGTGRKPLRLISRTEFVEEVFWKIAYRGHALVIGFNLPFDLTRIVRDVHYTQDGDGFSLDLRENPNRPRLQIWIDDSKRARIQFTKRQPFNKDDERDASFRGYFLDCKTLAFALTDKGYSLASVCEAFGVEHRKLSTEQYGVITAEYIDYCRRDVLATWELARELLKRFALHPIALAPWSAKSAASIGKAYLRAMGLAPRLALQPGFDKHALGDAMVAYFGGRVECTIRRTPVPVVYLDFTSMYPTVNSLMGLWRYFIAKRLDIVDATEETRAFLERVTRDAMFDRDTWKQLTVFVEVLPGGDVLPLRAQYESGGSYGIGLQEVESSRPLVYTLADCIASTLRTGKAPHVLRAWRLVPAGVQEGLRPVQLAGEIAVAPRTDDFFRFVIEARNRLPDKKSPTGTFLKVLANSSSYGIYVERNPERLGAGERAAVAVYGTHAFSTRVVHPEKPGEWCFPPLGALITGAARLMLALLEALVTESGGSYAFCDTDSMAIVASEHGGLIPCEGGPEQMPDGTPAIRALSWEQVDAIRQRFAALNPYDPEAVPGSVLKVEDMSYTDCGLPGHDRDERGQPKRCICTKVQREVWAFSISSKRYALYTIDGNGEPVLAGVSAHGLGAYLPPDTATASPATDGADEAQKVKPWHRTAWLLFIREALVLPTEEPAWLDRIAMRRLTLSKPSTHRLFADLNAEKAYADHVKPANFLISPQISKTGYPPGVDRNRFSLVGPYETDPERWGERTYIDRYSGSTYRITPNLDYEAMAFSPERERTAEVVTYRELLRDYRTHPEAKRLGPDGRPCTRETVGLLSPRRVRVGRITHIGKESNELEARESGEITDIDEVQNIYLDTHDDCLRDMLVHLPRRPFAKLVGISERELRYILTGDVAPGAETRAKLVSAAATLMRDSFKQLGTTPGDIPRDFDALAATYAERLAAERERLTVQLRSLTGTLVPAGWSKPLSQRDVARMLTRTQKTVSNWQRVGVPAEPETLAHAAGRLKPIAGLLDRLAFLAADGFRCTGERERGRLHREYERLRVRLLNQLARNGAA